MPQVTSQTSIVSARIANMHRYAYDQALGARHIPSDDEERWAQALNPYAPSAA